MVATARTKSKRAPRKLGAAGPAAVVGDEDADTTEADATSDATDDTDGDSDAKAAQADEADQADEAADPKADPEDGALLKPQRAKAERPPLRRYLRRSIMPVLLAASLAVSGFLGWKQWQEHRIEQAGQQAQQAAIAYAQVLTSIDSNNVDENFRQVLDGATGEFKDMYTQSSVKLRQLLIDNKATAHGVVVDSAIQSASTNTVVVLVFIDQTVTNTAAPDPRIDRSRIKMTMQKVDGRWRAGKVQLL